MLSNMTWTWPPIRSVKRDPRPCTARVSVHTRHRFEELARQVHGRAAAGGRQDDLAGICFAYVMNPRLISPAVTFVTSMTFGTPTRPATGAMSRRKLKRQIRVERRVDRIGRVDEQHGIAVGRRTRPPFRAHVVAGTRPLSTTTC